MKKFPRYIYRGLRHEEIIAGCVLIPKAQRPFLAHPRLPITLPFNLGENLEHAVREHQWVEKEETSGELKPLFETSGVSTTPHYYRAMHYAKNKVIVKIDTIVFEMVGILAYVVSDYIDRDRICVPEDDEIILVCGKENPFPKKIVAEIVLLS